MKIKFAGNDINCTFVSDKQFSFSLILFFMALSPVLITRSVAVLDSKKSKQLISTTFIAKFSDGTEKFLNQKKWEVIGLLRTCDIGNQPMSMNECTLYFKDWSNNPMFGTMEGNYPPSTLPNEILNNLK